MSRSAAGDPGGNMRFVFGVGAMLVVGVALLLILWPLVTRVAKAAR